MVRFIPVGIACLSLSLALGCTDKTEKMKERQKIRDEEKKTFEKQALEAQKAAAPKVDAAKLDAEWDSPDFVKIANGKKCPEGLWALFPSTPGEGSEKDANDKKKPELAEKMRKATYVAVLHHGLGVTLGKYDKKKKALSVTVEGVLACFDGLGLLTVAFGDGAKPKRPPKGKGADDEMSPQAVWDAKPLTFQVPFEDPLEAKVFAQGEGLGTDARIVFTLGKTEVDEMLEKVLPNEEAGTKGGTVDWGAGRLVHATVKGVRLASDHEKHLLVESRPGKD
ncbi:MAG: hypothetical protein AB1938_23235 [Myxococcota bacterium]